MDCTDDSIRLVFIPAHRRYSNAEYIERRKEARAIPDQQQKRTNRILHQRPD